ncbi:hypothetical protein LUZ61_014301 [Rhynchospora tenuis]|uniref:Interactor of constitutive active ROPs 4-like n=1 Tax=Rhynchospora tenuis TaxID=198213 RepID=A0AAD5WAM2_9POAL|nr:hypothetical protein LUZ61_014301 [Rhynchospora tenuis]
MPRSRGTELPQRSSPRVPLKLKTTVSTESNGVSNHRERSMVDRSPKVHDHRSPRSNSPLHEKKRGTRVVDLETKLGKAQEELKKLREQLASAEAAKKDAQNALETAKKHVGRSDSVVTCEPVTEEIENLEVESKIQELEIKESTEVTEAKFEVIESVNSVVTSTTDVFEVIMPVETLVENKENIGQIEGEQVEKEKKEEEEEDKDAMKIIEEAVLIQEVKEDNQEEKQISELAELKVKLLEREKEIEALSEEKTEMKKKAEEAMEQANKMEETMRVAVAAKEALEAEMRRLRVQTDQWRKAAEAAAAVLANGDCDMIPGRCGSMEKGFIGSGGNGGLGYGWGSPGVGEEDEGKRRSGSGMRMFGELWKKRGQQK